MVIDWPTLHHMVIEWHVGDVVRKLRLQKHLTQKELAKAAGVHHNTIVRLEDGDEGVQGRTLTRVATALGVTAKEIWSYVPEQETQRSAVPSSDAAGQAFQRRK